MEQQDKVQELGFLPPLPPALYITLYAPPLYITPPLAFHMVITPHVQELRRKSAFSPPPPPSFFVPHPLCLSFIRV